MDNKIEEFENVLESLNALGVTVVGNQDSVVSIGDFNKFQRLQNAIHLLGKKIDELKNDYDHLSYREGHFMATGTYEN